MISSFSVQDRTTLTAEREAAPLDIELSIADVSVHTWPGLTSTGDVPAQIAAALLCSTSIRPHMDYCVDIRSPASSIESRAAAPRHRIEEKGTKEP